MTSKIVLYDLPTRAPTKCWSLNPWKTRALLNYKGILYETQWVEYPDIKPKFEKHVPPNERGAAYTIPTVRFQDGSYMQDSKEIAKRIEKEHPHPEMHLGSDYLTQVEVIMSKLVPAVAPDFIPKVCTRLLNEASLPYWYETREAFFGMPLDQVEREKGGDTAWMEAADHVRQVTQLLKEKNGPFFEGSQVTYVDFVWAGFMRFMETIGPDMLAKVYDVCGDEGVLKEHYKACAPWLERDNH